jgi:hypothetical protein
VEGPACEYKKNQGLFKEKSLAEPWILDPTTDAAVGHVVSSAHGSMVDGTEGVSPN